MSAERLREAARVLRERAEGATDGGSRWETGPDDMRGPSSKIIYPADSDSAVAFAGAEDAEYIAAMHPGVGLALADWLDREANSAAAGMSIGARYPSMVVADQILGGVA